MHAVGSVLHESPMPSVDQLKPLHDELVATAPPLRDKERFGHRPPHALAGGVEDALGADLTIRGRRDDRRSQGVY